MLSVAHRAAIPWLLAHAGPSVRWQTRTSLAEDAPGDGLAQARRALEEDAQVRRLLEAAAQAVADFRFTRVHGATNTQLENLLPMLLDRGLNRTFPAFDAVFGAVPALLRDKRYGDAHTFHSFADIVLVPFLLAAGYDDAALTDFYTGRLSLTSGFCSRMDFDIFGEQGGYRGIPKTFRDRQVIRPALYADGAYQFPLIYDLYGHAAMYPRLDAAGRAQIDHVLRYVLAEPYQAFPFGYGILVNPGHRARYHAMGWDCVLPKLSGGLTAPVLHRMELLAAFPLAVRSAWFQSALRLLDAHQEAQGVYALPPAVLQEKEACWLLGNHMGLGENRRKPSWRLVEGTFRALRLHSRLL